MSICCCCKNFRKNRLFDVEKERVPGSEGQILSLQINNDWEEVISSPNLANFLPLICHHWGKLSIFFLPVVASLCNNLICNKRPARTAIHHTPQIYWPCSLPMGIAYFHSKRKHFLASTTCHYMQQKLWLWLVRFYQSLFSTPIMVPSKLIPFHHFRVETSIITLPLKAGGTGCSWRHLYCGSTLFEDGSEGFVRVESAIYVCPCDHVRLYGMNGSGSIFGNTTIKWCPILLCHVLQQYSQWLRNYFHQ